ncbi:MAG: glutamyl-tRNA reductase [Fibrobacter sp.]|jgi:glutamyl-tRNA reductase|nr:glutamyl-tRNA reductase [Fibrobacter sp.]
MSIIQENYHCVVLGISHKTCSVALRDRLGFSGDSLEAGLSSLKLLPGISEAVILSTCNRIEIYAATLYPESLRDTLIHWWANFCRIDESELIPYCFYHTHAEAVFHLYSVVSSIDSLVLGENQILAQVKNAFLFSQKAGYLDFFLNHLFQSAIALGKRVREQTKIGEGSVSVAFLAVECCRHELGDLSSARAGVLGLGEMGALAVSNLYAAGVRDFYFFNRTFQKSEEFAGRYGGRAIPLNEVNDSLGELDLLITCAQSSEYLVRVSGSSKAGRPKTVLVDIASPRNMDPQFAVIDGFSLFSLDDLNQAVTENRLRRRHAVSGVRDLIDSALEDFILWYHSLSVVPLIRKFSRYHEQIGTELLEKWKYKVPPETLDVLERFQKEFCGKILHEPLSQLKKIGGAGLGLESKLLLEKLYHLEAAGEENHE